MMMIVRTSVFFQNVLESCGQDEDVKLEGDQIHKDFRLWITTRVDNSQIIPGKCYLSVTRTADLDVTSKSSSLNKLFIVIMWKPACSERCMTQNFT
jgi:hypothetical protein